MYQLLFRQAKKDRIFVFPTSCLMSIDEIKDFVVSIDRSLLAEGSMAIVERVVRSKNLVRRIHEQATAWLETHVS